MEKQLEELKKLKTARDTIQELSSNYAETLHDIKGFSESLKSAKALWKNANNKSRLIKMGLTLIALPEPTPFSEMMGATLLSIGLIQQKIRNSGLHIEDVHKTFQDVFKNLRDEQRDLVRY